MSNPRIADNKRPRDSENSESIRTADDAEQPQKKNQVETKNQSHSIFPIIYKTLIDRVLEKNKTALLEMLPAVNANNEILRQMTSNDMNLAYEFFGSSDMSVLVMPLIWVLEKFARERNCDIVNWLLETFHLPTDVAIKGYASGGHDDCAQPLIGRAENKKIIAALGQVAAGNLTAIDLEKVLKSFPQGLLESCAENDNEEMINKIIKMLDKDHHDDMIHRALLRGYARGGHLEKALPYVKYIDENNIDDYKTLIVELARSGHLQALNQLLFHCAPEIAGTPVNQKNGLFYAALGILFSGMLIPSVSSLSDWKLIVGENNLLFNTILGLYLAIHPDFLLKTGLTELDIKGAFLHGKILDLSEHLELQFNRNGACIGISTMASQAWLIYEENILHERLRIICEKTSAQLAASITDAMARIKSNKYDDNDLNFLEIRVFLEGVSLAQNPEKYPTLFARYSHNTAQNNTPQFLPMIASKKLGKVGGMHSVCNYSGVYRDSSELAAYLESIRDYFCTNTPNFKNRIGLSLVSDRHCLFVGYDADKKSFYFNNSGHIVNGLINSTTQLAEFIRTAFGTEKAAVFTTNVFATGNDLESISAAFASFRQSLVFSQIHSVTHDKACDPNYTDSNEAGWLDVASASDQNETVVELLAAGADMSHTPKNALPPLLAAAYQGDPQVIQTLLNAGADINQTSAAGTTALLEAAGKNNAAAVELLLARRADVDIGQKSDGMTAEEIARLRGYDDIVMMIQRSQCCLKSH